MQATIANNRIEGGLDECVDQLRRRVIRARGLTLGTKNKFKLGPASSIVIHCGMKLEQTLVHRAELFNIQRGVVDATRRASCVFLIPGKRPEGVEQVMIGNGEGIEGLRGKKLASITASATFGHSASPDNVTCWHIMALQ